MKKSNLISVIVPVYNVEEYIDKCIMSLINQTYTNLEIILVDDGSTDNCPVICDKWAAKDSRIKVIHTANNGVSHARNVGLDNVTGDYIGFLDSDDWIEADMYEKLLAAINEDDSDVCGGGYIKDFGDYQETILKVGEPSKYTNIDAMKWMFSVDRPKLLFWEVCDKLFKKNIITGVRFKENVTMCEDMLFTWNVLKNTRKLSYRPLHKYHYMMRSESACHIHNFKHRLDSAVSNMELYSDQWLQDSELKKIIHERFLNGVISKMKLLLLYPKKFDYNVNTEVKELQHYLRYNLCKVVISSNRSLRMRLGAVLLSLPLFFTKKMLPLVVKSEC